MKEWLGFLGGLFAFLAVLIPIVRRFWRMLRRKISARELMLLIISVFTLGTFFPALIGVWLGWNHAVATLLLLCSFFGLLALFVLSSAPLTRSDIGGFVFGSISIAVFAAHEFNAMEVEQSQRTSLKQLETPSPSPSATP